MSQALKRVLFSEEYRVSSAVQAFDCGSEKWQREVSKWLKSPRAAVLAPAHPTRRSDVWLYLTQSDELVGFGSLGRTVWVLREPYNGPVTINIIPYMGINRIFWGKPENAPPDDRYSTLIMEDLIAEAEEACRRDGIEPFLCLYVHPLNEQAKKFYKRMRFEPFDRESNGNESMLRELAPYDFGESRENEAHHMTTEQSVSEDVTAAADMHTFEDAVAAVLNAPPTPEQQAKKAVAEKRRESRKKQKQAPTGK